MAQSWFDEHAAEYDSWFERNRDVLESEVLLLARMIGDAPGSTLSVGCGSGLFEHILRIEHGIDIRHGVEPAAGMADIARRRGMDVQAGSAESLPVDDGSFDTVVMNGIPSYVADLEAAFREAARVLRRGGHVVVLDVPAESSYGLLYRLATVVGSWDDPFLARVAPAHPYPIEFAAAANWRTTAEKAELLERCGFMALEYAQTLTRHPHFSDRGVEQPVAGFDRGDYVGIRARLG